ncbi:hypothetical protein Glove_979g4 [Diversispora epigaea]|uniref:Hexosyltransferase n=1 Tax=Diversispora epigaea TaxID=1348612 RepID=A0A397G240_9GLOM|nr:hypothetical protein Glove_979g4 [Diversispora epigaea]
MKHANIINPNLGISVVLASDALVPEEYNIPTLDYKQIPSENYQNLSLKVFEIFKIVWKNYGSRYDYFMKADDDVFIKIEKLSKTFFNTNSDLYDSESIEYFGYPDPYQKLMCWGGPGYIISRGTLRLIYPYLEFCENEFHYGEDISLYQCIEYVTKLLNKTSEFKGCQHLHNQSGWNFGNAITVHSLKPGNNITMRDLEERYGREN